MMPSSRSYSAGCTYTVNRLGASVEYFSGSRFFRMLSTTASMRSRAARRELWEQDSVGQQAMTIPSRACHSVHRR